MRRFLFGIAIASLTASVPATVLGGDQEIADAIVSTLNHYQSDGSLKGFDIDIRVDNGKVVLTGRVTTDEQLQAVLKAANSVSEVQQVVNQMEVAAKTPPAKVNMPKPFSLREAISNPDYAAEFVGRSNPVTTASTIEEVATPVVPNQPAAQLTQPIQPALPMQEPPRMNSEETNVSPQDARITDQLISKLSADKSSGKLRFFELELSTVQGEVWVRGYVANTHQKLHVLQTIQRTPGVKRVVDDIFVKGQENVQPASAEQGSSMPVVSPQPIPVPQVVTPVQPVAPVQQAVPVQQSVPVQQFARTPVPFAPSRLASNVGGQIGPEASIGTPVPMQGSGQSYGPGVPRYDQPNMPNYSWPSYAAHPNYAAVTYPKQYSASAWPYIGPFYPYPQVPLGWRKVSLEWDDGLWYLDFTSKR